MKKEEILKKKEELKKEIDNLYTDILKEMCNKKEYLNDELWETIGRKINMEANECYYISYDTDFTLSKFWYVTENNNEFNGLSEEVYEKFIIEKEKEFEKHTKMLEQMLERHSKLKYDFAFGLDKLIDMEMDFDGDIIITDPCYIMKKPDKSTEPKWEDYISCSFIKDYPDYDDKKKQSETYFKEQREYFDAHRQWNNENNDYEICEAGTDISHLGFTKYMTRNTLYGDWSCTTYDLDSNKEIGNFCADSGMVSVFLLDEVMKYNPEYKHVKENSWCVTCIRDFKGAVEFRVEHIEGFYEDTTEYHKAGDKWEDNVVKVYGHGINKITGKPINFVGMQTGF